MRINELACSNIAVLAPILYRAQRYRQSRGRCQSLRRRYTCAPFRTFEKKRERERERKWERPCSSSKNDDSAVNQPSWRAHDDARVSYFAKIKPPTRTLALFIFSSTLSQSRADLLQQSHRLARDFPPYSSDERKLPIDSAIRVDRRKPRSARESPKSSRSFRRNRVLFKFARELIYRYCVNTRRRVSLSPFGPWMNINAAICTSRERPSNAPANTHVLPATKVMVTGDTCFDELLVLWPMKRANVETHTCTDSSRKWLLYKISLKLNYSEIS